MILTDKAGLSHVQDILNVGQMMTNMIDDDDDDINTEKP
jgi:hypothetical protein